MEDHVSIGRVKRDISALVHRVASRGERILLTSRGEPKAALVSLEDYRRLQEEAHERRRRSWRVWLAETEELSREILERRQGKPLDVDELLRLDRQDLEARGG